MTGPLTLTAPRTASFDTNPLQITRYKMRNKFLYRRPQNPARLDHEGVRFDGRHGAGGYGGAGTVANAGARYDPSQRTSAARWNLPGKPS